MRTAITLLGVLLATGCGVGAPAGSASQAPYTTSSPSAGPTVGPSATAQATASPVRTPAPTLDPTPTPTDDSSYDPPPDGLLSAGGAPVAAWLGSYCYDDACMDVGDLPAKTALPQVVAAAGGSLRFTLADGVPFYYWSATYAEELLAPQPVRLGEGGSDHDWDSAATPPPELHGADLDLPPPGDWAVSMYLRFDDGEDASYHWRVTVE